MKYKGYSVTIVWLTFLLVVQSALASTPTQKQVTLLAVLDTGVDLEDEALQNSFWENEREIPNNGKDDDGNGYVDDYIGFDAIENKGSGVDEDSTHGTTVCRIASGHDQDVQIPEDTRKFIRIVPIRVLPGDEQPGNGYSIVRAIAYALKLQEQTGLNMVINISWVLVQGDNDDIRDILEVARNRGVLVVAAAGNDYGSKPRYPAAYNFDNIISVSGTYGLAIATYSNWFSDIAAEGSVIIDGTFEKGTSFAAPRVSLVASAVFAQHRNWSYREVKKHVLKTADHLPQLKAKVRHERRLNELNALALK